MFLFPSNGDPRIIRRYVAVLLVLFIALPMQAGKSSDWFERSLDFTVELFNHYPAVENSEELERLNSIAYRIVAQLPETNYPYSFQIVKMRAPNAFALPGGFIFITSGMLKLELTDGELAALIGHEITHVWKEHAVHQQKKATLLTILTQMVVMGIMMGMKDNQQYRDDLPWLNAPDHRYPGYDSRKANYIQGALAFGAVFQELLLQGYSRRYELESDREGMRLMAMAGFDPQGGLDLLTNLHRRVFEAPGYGYWRSHPYFEDRVEAASIRLPGIQQQSPYNATEFRKKTQQEMLLMMKEYDSEKRDVLKRIAYYTYPHGPAALKLKKDEIDNELLQLMQYPALKRGYGDVLIMVDEVIDHFEGDPELGDRSMEPFLTVRETLIEEKEICRPAFRGILEHGVPDIPFLNTFLSNYPEDPLAGEAAYRLFEYNRRLDREDDALDALLTTYEHSEWREAAIHSALSYISRVETLHNCNKLLMAINEAGVQEIALQHMETLASSYTEMKDGAEYLEEQGDSIYAPVVQERLYKLAFTAYQKGSIYERVGESQKALDIFNDILLHAPESDAAVKIREYLLKDDFIMELGGSS